MCREISGSRFAARMCIALASWLVMSCMGGGGLDQGDEPSAEGIELADLDRGSYTEGWATAAAACSGQPGGGSFCNSACPCSDGQGDCDSDAECGPGLRCYRDVGTAFGWGADVDVCMAACPTAGSGSLDFCSPECPCAAEQGDCDSDAECAPGLKCVKGGIGTFFGWDADVDVCLDRCSVFNMGAFDHCAEGCPCSGGRGDCDSDAECAEGLRCGSDNGAEFGFDEEVDVCIGAGTTTSLAVTVRDDTAELLAGATISVDGTTLVTDETGMVEITGMPQGRVVVQVTSPGYTESAVPAELVPNLRNDVSVYLHALGEPVAFDASQGSEILGEDGIKLNVPAGALVDGSGLPVIGEAQATIVPLSMEGPDSAAAPGPPVGEIDGNLAIIEGSAMLDITFWNDDEKLQIASGAAVEVEIPVPAESEIVYAPGDQVELWYYDQEIGYWVPDTVGVIQESTETPGTLVLRAEIRHNCWFIVAVAVAIHVFNQQQEEQRRQLESQICHQQCNSCNPCDWRPCDDGAFCTIDRQKYLMNTGGALTGCQVWSNLPYGTGLPSQSSPSDCGTDICDGTGRQTVTPNNLEIPVADGTDCTIDRCIGGNAAYPPAMIGTVCNAGAGAGTCDGSGNCEPPSCDDTVRNNSETDIDCGGPNCGPCNPGRFCQVDDDCTSRICVLTAGVGICNIATCNDSIQNGTETDVDCGGPSCIGCPAGDSCNSTADCGAGLVCIANTCQ